MFTKDARVPPKDFHNCVSKMREFFTNKGFIEAHPQSRLSILSACEDPHNLRCFKFGGTIWPMIQTNQMTLEHELLQDDSVPGYFCLTTSYRDENKIVENRHNTVFPMFEFELKGGMDDMILLVRELCEHLGFGSKDSFKEEDYDIVAKKYGVKELEVEHENQMEKDYGKVFFLKNFPNYTSPFWNMKQYESGTHSHKVDVIIGGHETVGSAERSCNKDEMREQFYSIMDGEYSKILFDKFGKERVEKELDEFLSYNFMRRSGGGIGLTRLIRAMKSYNLL